MSDALGDGSLLPDEPAGTQRDSHSVVAESISWGVGAIRILEQVTASGEAGQVTGLIGPNGSGKSSLLRIVAGVNVASSGVVEVAGQSIAAMKSRAKARTLAFVEQDSGAQRSLSVLDAVLLGRLPHRGLLAPPSDADVAVARECLGRVGLEHFAGRDMATLSGGERQRVMIAKALAQDTDVLIVDEPTNHLDIAAQLAALDTLRGLAAQGKTVITALHDLNLSAGYCDQIVVLSHGSVVAHGAPDQVLTTELIRKVYEVECQVLTNPLTGKPLLAFA